MRDSVALLSEARGRQKDHRTSHNSEKFAPPHRASGIDALEQLGCGSLPGEINLIMKPYTREELGRKLRHVLRNE
jgi:hypothetical protein